MRILRAFLAGVAGGAVMSLFMAIGRHEGIDIEIENLFGALAGFPPSRARWVMGFVLHLGISGVLGLAYAAVFEISGIRAGFRLGVLISFFHVAAVGALLALVPPLRFVVPHALNSPGSFLANVDRTTMLAFVVLHAIFGAVVGQAYAPSELDIMAELEEQVARARTKKKKRPSFVRRALDGDRRYARTR